VCNPLHSLGSWAALDPCRWRIRNSSSTRSEVPRNGIESLPCKPPVDFAQPVQPSESGFARRLGAQGLPIPPEADA
jgi:hypothetical protein